MHDLARIAGLSPGPCPPAALATIVRTHGSAYRRAGARMLIPASGATIGALSGGCLEDAIAERGRHVIARGEPCALSFDTRAMLGCHGVIEVFIERIGTNDPAADLLGHVAQRLAIREAAVVTTRFAGTLPLGSWPLTNERANDIPRELADAMREVLATLRPRCCQFADEETLIDVIPPPIRLVIVGAGHDVAPLARLARSLGWHWQIVVPAGAPVAGPLADSPELSIAAANEFAARLRPDRLTAVVVMTHHFGRDLAFLDALLPLPLPYLGLLGPARRREQLLAALFEARADGEMAALLDPSSLSKLRSPVGLDLGGDSPEEVALSIVAEIRAALAGRTARPLRDRKGPIHALAEPRADRIFTAVPA